MPTSTLISIFRTLPLTTNNEANMLKFKELIGILTPEETQRWESIKYALVENVKMAGIDGDDQAAQLMVRLTSMRDGLESIRQVISKATEMNRDAAETRMDERVADLRTSFATAGEQLTDALRQTSQQLQEISRQQAANPPDQKVVVQHKVPRVMLDLVRGQFHLMQEWMRPIMMESGKAGRDLSELKGLVEKTLLDYDRLRADLEDASEPPSA